MQSVKEQQLSDTNRSLLTDLADNLYYTRGPSQDDLSQDEGNYVLFIGGEASTIQGRPFIEDLQFQMLTARVNPIFSLERLNEMFPDVRQQHFNNKWDTPAHRVIKTRLLRETLRKLVFTEGHLNLAQLLKEGYFPLVLTTAIDQLIETAFISRIVREGESLPHWAVLVNGHNTPEDFQRTLHSNSGTSILKLCGNIQTPAISQAEIEEKIRGIEQTIGGALQRNLIIIAPTPLDEMLLLRFPNLKNAQTSSIHYIGARPPLPALQTLLAPRVPIYIVEEKINFDLVLKLLYKQISIYSEVEEATGTPLQEEEREAVRRAARQENQTEQGVVSTILSSRVTAPIAPAAPGREPAARQIADEATRSQIPSGQSEEEDALHLNEDDEELIELLPLESEEESVAALVETVVLTVKLDVNRKASFALVGGPFNYTSSQDSNTLDFDVDDFNTLVQDMGRDHSMYQRMSASSVYREAGLESWRRRAKHSGKELYGKLIQAYPLLSEKLKLAQSTVEKFGQSTVEKFGPENLTLVFDGPREFLGMPYEFLFDDDWLVLNTPLCRRVSGLNPRHAQHFDAFIHALRRSKQPLRMLFISAGAPELSADKEIEELQQRISVCAEHLGLKLESKIISSTQSNYDTVQKQLVKCKYHIIHYAGHGVFQPTGEDSGLLLRKKANSKEYMTLTARELAGLLAASETRLVYLSTCSGAETGSNHLLRDFDYLGVIDAVVRAGIPYALGFRWTVTDGGSRRFATHFYDQLFEQPHVPERAAWYARRKIYHNNGHAETWISPILVAQNPYR